MPEDASRRIEMNRVEPGAIGIARDAVGSDERCEIRESAIRSEKAVGARNDGRLDVEIIRGGYVGTNRTHSRGRQIAIFLMIIESEPGIQKDDWRPFGG